MNETTKALVLSGGGGRGAYQAGVWAWLEQQYWRPGLVTGTSVGAINGAAIASGMSGEQLQRLWTLIDEDQVYRYRPWRNIMHWLKRLIGRAQGTTALADTEPLRRLMSRELDFDALRTSDIELIVAAVRILDGMVRYFDQRQIGVEHLMASSAIPVLFPWQFIDGEAHWDGGLAVNTPLLPVIQRGIAEVVVVLFVPVQQGLTQLPSSRRQAIEWTYELSTLASADAIVSLLLTLQGGGVVPDGYRRGDAITIGATRFHFVAPERPMGMNSLLHFGGGQTELLFNEGYRDAEAQLTVAIGAAQ